MSSSSTTSEIPAAFDADLEPGQVIGEYRVESKIGQGGFGTVFKAVHPLIGKVVAIKVLARKFSVDPEMVSRFVAEARAVNQIRNRHIIDIFSFGALEDGRAYYVMEFLEGEPLDATIDRAGRMGLEQALPILRSIARALDAAHSKGIAHRDLKPENVFLVSDPDGVWPKLLDFGIAKLVTADEDQKHKTRTGMPIGTPYYMSPEQCRGKDVDHRTDYYAFGVVAYQMLTGKHPIDAEDYMEIMMKQITDEPAPPSSLVPDLPPGIDDAIAWLMKKDREQRPPNLVSAMRALEQAAEASGISIPRAGSAMWDAQSGEVTPMPGSISRMSTPLPGALGAAQTMAPTQTIAPVAKKSRALLFGAIGIAVLAVVAAVAVAVTRAPTATEPVKPAVVTVVPDAAPAPHTVAPVDAVATPALPASIIVTITGVPDGTEVALAGTVIGVAPGPVQVPYGTADAVLTFKADGFFPLSKAVTPDHPQPLDVQLKPKPHTTTPTKTHKDDIIEVFGKKH